MLNIGNVKIENPLVLAPLAAVGNTAFRYICKKYGAGLIYTPMIHSNSLAARKDEMIDVIKEERPVVLQIIGHDKEKVKEAVNIAQDHCDIIDINFGCPQKEQLANKEGGFFMKHPDQMEKLFSKASSATNKPITAKIRTGWDNKSINALDVSKMLEDNDAAAIAVHGRTVKQGYSGKADWEIIKEVKEKVNVPIIGNGDISKPGHAKYYLERKYCDMVMIGRAAMGNPFIFKRTLALLKDGKSIPEPDKEDRINMFKEFLKYYKKYVKRDKFSEVKQHFLWAMQKFEGSKELRTRSVHAKSMEDIEALI